MNFQKVVFILCHFYLLFQQNKGKKKKKGVVAGGGLKAQMRDDLDYAEFDGGYAQDYEDFMWQWPHYYCPLSLSALRSTDVPSHAVQCHPGKSELCCPLHFCFSNQRDYTRNHPVSPLLMFLHMELPFLSHSASTSTHTQSYWIWCVTQLQQRIHNCCCLSFAGLLFFIKCCSCQKGRCSITVIIMGT